MKAKAFLSTPSARRATPEPCSHQQTQPISIHALRKEGDKMEAAVERYIEYISIHALRKEGDSLLDLKHCHVVHFYPRPPQGGRLCRIVEQALQEELFLSTPSARRATGCIRSGWRCRTISIHALRKEGDCGATSPSAMPSIFLSTPSARRATCQT